MERFRLIHISDLHYASTARHLNLKDGWGRIRWRQRQHVTVFEPSSFEPTAAESIAYYVVDAEADGIVISGDIATTGTDDDLDPALEFVHAPAQNNWFVSVSRRAPSLRCAQFTAHESIVLIPGNHDRYRFRRVPYGAGCNRFDVKFKDYWSHGQHAAHLRTLRRGTESLILLGADFSVRRAALYSHIGQGKARKTIVDELVKYTNKARADEERLGLTAAAVWVIHFAPEFPHRQRQLRLRGEGYLLDQAVRANVQHILCGHTHEPEEYQSQRHPNVNIYCAASATEFMSKHGNFIHEREIDVEKGQIVGKIRTHYVGIANDRAAWWHA